MIYERPNTVSEAVEILSKSHEKKSILAGGTDLLVQMRSGYYRPSHIVDIKNIPEATQIRDDGDTFLVGAGVPGAQLSEHVELIKAWPGVIEAMDLIGSTQIQGRATLGGNLCNASPAADSVPAMIAADATCIIAGPNGYREEKIENVVTAPGVSSIANNEFVVSIRLAKFKTGRADAYLRFIPRTEMDIAVVGAAVCVLIDKKGICLNAKVSLGAVAPTQVVIETAPQILIGTRLDEETLDKLAKAARASCNPIDDKRGTIEYRTSVAGVLTKRAAKIAFDRAGGA
ncbi:MAG: oxidoreductase [Rhodospirillaceae bacterium]|nr:oxidoreductase [Rhodospirillaceae bacterium]|tara:strand:- start:4521 stop:5381 length:861 start_codon:yes stop_codon:yes gene_type:complete